MKKLIILALSAVVIPLSSCDNPTMADYVTNPFIGTWENDTTWWIFTETDVKHSTINPSQDPLFLGAFTFDDTHITITTTFRHSDIPISDGWPQPLVLPYWFEDGKLRIAFGDWLLNAE